MFLKNLTGQDLLQKKERPRPNRHRCLPRNNCSPKTTLILETVEMSACEPSTSFEDDTCKTPDLERQIAEQSTKIGELEEKLKQAESEINLHHKNIELNEKLAECKCQQKEMSLRLFCVDRFTTETFHRGRHFFLHWSVQLCDFYGHFRVVKSWRQLCKHSPPWQCDRCPWILL